MNKNKLERIFLVIGATTAWFAVVIQLYLLIANSGPNVIDAIIRFFSYFTILTNTLIAICYSALLSNKNSSFKHFFAKPSVRSALTVYILIVGLIYNVVLRNLWSPQGMQYVVDELLHTFDPAFFLLYWLIFVSKASLRYKYIFSWMLYPLAYTIYTFVLGEITNWYPYPFLEVSQLGYVQVLINYGWVTLSFLIVSVLLVSVNKILSRNRN